jgi:hypothetical protein
MMKNLSNLERRVAVLERAQNMSGIDPLVFAMETLEDTELGILEEYMSLLNAGFPLEQIADMMGEESYQQALGIVAKVDQELRLRTEPERRMRCGKALKMPRQHRYNESGLGVPEDAEA